MPTALHVRNFLVPSLVAALFVPIAHAAESTCYGQVAKGRLENGVSLPPQGSNFVAYSKLGVDLGRTYLHSQVRSIILDAYKALEQAAPATVFVYGETGWKSGGRIKPHRTHQNGTSIDFMVPVQNRQGVSVPLPTSAMNQFGYALEFDAQGRLDDLTIDFAAIGEHLYQLSLAAKRRNAGISLVIFEQAFMPKLFATKHGPYLQAHLPFMKGKPWVRHDEHYHIDFAVKCRPLNQ